MSEIPPSKIRRVEKMDVDSESQDVESSMDVDSSNESNSSQDEQPLLDILTNKICKIDDRFMAYASKEMTKNSKRNCKIMKFPSTIIFSDVLIKIEKVKHQEFPRLLIFIIEAENCNFYGSNVNEMNYYINKSIESLSIFHNTRPLLLQLTSKDENSSKFFVRKEKSKKFIEVKDGESFEEPKDFQTFFWAFINGEKIIQEFYNDDLMEIEDSGLIIRLFTCFKLEREYWDFFVLQCARRGTKNQFLSALDVPFEQNLDIHEAGPLNRTFSVENSNFLPDHCDGNQNSMQSVLSIAVINNNEEIIDYLITKCTHFNQQLPFDHQLQISTVALKSNTNVLCDLLECADYPFPDNFNNEIGYCQRLNGIAEERKAFHNAILTEDLAKIKSFIENNCDLKIAYYFDNQSALFNALKYDKIKIYCHLKNIHGFKLSPHEKLEDVLDEKKRLAITTCNVDNSLHDLSIILLASRSTIHDKKIDKQQKLKYRGSIKKWYIEINDSKFGCHLINAVSQCEDLKIIYDFESELVNDADLIINEDALGTTHSNLKWIFIGAKVTSSNPVNKIRGTIAHEFCHYAMYLIFENKMLPYPLNSIDCSNLLQNIVDKYASNFRYTTDDKCDGIISIVFSEEYPREIRQQELIVRIAEICARYYGEDEKLKELFGINMYSSLHNYYEKNIVPALKNFNFKQKEAVRKLNKIIGLLPEIMDSKMEVLASKIPIGINENKIMVITSNVPGIFLADLWQHLTRDFGNIFDTKNIFIAPDVLRNKEILKDFQEILVKNFDLRTIIDCRTEMSENLLEAIKRNCTKLIFVGSNQTHFNKLPQIEESSKSDHQYATINYNWNDLETETHESLLQTDLNFQKTTDMKLLKLLTNEDDTIQPSIPSEPSNFNRLSLFASALRWISDDSQSSSDSDSDLSQNNDGKYDHLANVIDKDLLNLLVDKTKISINENFIEFDDSEKYFEWIFQSRKFIKHFTKERTIKIAKDDLEWNKKFKKIKSHAEINDDTIEAIEIVNQTEEISQEQQLDEVKSGTFVIISDVAGTGKSWMLKNIANLINEKFPGRWISLVDLKKFIKAFESHNGEPLDFATFMTEKILATKYKFELSIFKDLYEKGRVVVLFDGFDEIFPDCAKFVTKLIKSFESNGGNQLWVTTRDYFEVDLKMKLKIDAVRLMQLDEFTDEDGSELIAACWILNELESKVEIKSRKDFVTIVKNFHKYETYKEDARKIINDIPISNAIGHPQYFKIIAEIFMENKKGNCEMTSYRIYSKFADKKYEIWCHSKGDIRKEANTKVQHKNMNFMRLHEFLAMKKYFPNENNFCDLKFDSKVWTDAEIVAGGFMSAKDGEFFFTHKTFQEYFAASFIVRILEDETWEIYPNFFIFFIKFLTGHNYNIIRMFINDALADCTIMENLKLKMIKFSELFSQNIRECEIFTEIFEQGRNNLVKLIIEVFRNMDYNLVVKILNNNIENIIDFTEKSETFALLQNFIFDHLKVQDLKEFCINNEILLNIACSKLDDSIVLDFFNSIAGKTDENYIQQLLLSCPSILFDMTFSRYFDSKKLYLIVLILTERISDINKIIDMIVRNERASGNIIQACMRVKDEKRLDTVWREILDFYAFRNIPHGFYNLLRQRNSDYRNRTALHFAAFCDKIEFHKTLWTLMIETFGKGDGLMSLLLLKDINLNNFFHILVAFANAEIIEFTFSFIKENLRDVQYSQILTSNGYNERNLLQKAADKSTDTKAHAALWNIMRDFCKFNEYFIRMIDERDEDDDNLLFIVVKFSTASVYRFMIKELENILSFDQMRNILRARNRKFNQNLVQGALKLSNSKKLIEMVISDFDKYS